MADSQPNRSGYSLLLGTDCQLPSILFANTKVPPATCVYFLIWQSEVLWVGKTKHLRSRLTGHKSAGRRWDECLYLRCDTKSLHSLEMYWTDRLQPLSASMETLRIAKGASRMLPYMGTEYMPQGMQ